MKVILDGTPQVIMSNPASRHNYFAWPSVARLQNGRIAVVASGFRLVHICPFGKAVISYSEDEGRTYTFPAPVIDTPLDDRDAGILAFGERGVIVTSFNNSVRFQRQNQLYSYNFLPKYLLMSLYHLYIPHTVCYNDYRKSKRVSVSTNQS